MADGGAEDIFLAYPMVGDFRIKRALALSQRVRRLILAVDSLEGAKALSDAAEAAASPWKSGWRWTPGPSAPASSGTTRWTWPKPWPPCQTCG